MAIQFSETSSPYNGLIQECERRLFAGKYGVISGNTDLLAGFTDRINRGLDRVVSVIERSDGRWQWDDTNRSDFPIATTNLVSGQQDYAFATSHIEILKVHIKDSDSNWVEVNPIDIKDSATPLEELYETNGQPEYYDKLGNSLFLYPAPDYNSTGGLKIFYKRGPVYFTTSDTTATPGINPLFHMYPALYACRDYAIEQRLTTAGDFQALLGQMESDITDSYARRSGDERGGIRIRTNNPH